MPRFWKRRHSDPIETLLRTSRPEPRGIFVASTLARLESEPRHFRAAALRRRVVAATLVTAVAAGAALAAGGASALSSSITGLVTVASHGLNGNDNGNGRGNGNGAGGATTTQTTTTTAAPTTTTTTTTTTTGDGQSLVAPTNQNGNGTNGSGGNRGESPGDHQYAVSICHQTGSSTNPWVELMLPPQGAANHLAHHPGDFVVTAGNPCPPS